MVWGWTWTWPGLGWSRPLDAPSVILSEGRAAGKGVKCGFRQMECGADFWGVTPSLHPLLLASRIQT